MSSRPSVINADAISYSLQSPSGSSRLMFMSPATINLALRGRSLSNATTLSTVEV